MLLLLPVDDDDRGGVRMVSAAEGEIGNDDAKATLRRVLGDATLGNDPSSDFFSSKCGK